MQTTIGRSSKSAGQIGGICGFKGVYRNDNNQFDPGISSLFDFTQGALGLLGAQYTPGFLNTDRRQVANIYGSYVVGLGLDLLPSLHMRVFACSCVFRNCINKRNLYHGC